MTSIRAGVCTALITVSAATAAEIRTIPPATGADVPLVVIRGELQPGDQRTFIDAALSLDKALVVLSGPGGNLLAGLAIGEAIRLKGFGTLVLPGFPCASACALAWLAGTPRILGRDARVGFHGAWREDSGTKVVTSDGNAVVGAYLTKLGLSYNAIAILTRPGPDDAQWLSSALADRLGLEVKFFDGPKDYPGTPAAQAGSTVPQQQQTAVLPAPSGGSLSPNPAPITIRPNSLQPPYIDLLRVDDATRVQQRLLDLGYLIEAPDGVWGPRSRAALRTFRQVARLGIDDSWDRPTEQLLFAPVAPKSPYNGAFLGGGQVAFARFAPPSGAEITPLNFDQAQSIQSRLAVLGFYRSLGDGNWGHGSRNALREFKLVNGLPFDDVWDGSTETALLRTNPKGASGTIFGRWATDINQCATREPTYRVLDVSGNELRLGSFDCKVDDWKMGREWRGTATCSSPQGQAVPPINIRFRIVGNRLIDASSPPPITFVRCPDVRTADD